jgi:hypothetical protein
MRPQSSQSMIMGLDGPVERPQVTLSALGIGTGNPGLFPGVLASAGTGTFVTPITTKEIDRQY